MFWPPNPRSPPSRSFSNRRLERHRPQIAQTHRPARHFQHPVEALLGRQPQWLGDLDPRLQIAQRDVELFQRIQRHVRADVAVAVAVRAGRADEGLGGDRQLHLVDDVRLGGDDQGVPVKVLAYWRMPLVEPT